MQWLIAFEADDNLLRHLAVPADRTTPSLEMGNYFWARGYCVDTVGLDAEKIRKWCLELGDGANWLDIRPSC